MLFKFVGADNPTRLTEIFDSTLTFGRLKFSPALGFNDPQEFKHRSVYPNDFDSFDRWHDDFAPDRSNEDRRQAWRNLTGAGRDFIVDYEQRLSNLSRLAVTCFAETADNFLMWSHYSRAHAGFAVIFNTSILETFRQHAGWLCDGPVQYLEEPPLVQWFNEAPQSATQKIVFCKSAQWSYEREYRVVMDLAALSPDGLVEVRRCDIAGVVLGARASHDLRNQALALQAKHPELRVAEVCPRPGEYAFDITDIDPNSTRLFREIL